MREQLAADPNISQAELRARIGGTQSVVSAAMRAALIESGQLKLRDGVELDPRFGALIRVPEAPAPLDLKAVAAEELARSVTEHLAGVTDVLQHVVQRVHVAALAAIEREHAEAAAKIESTDRRAARAERYVDSLRREIAEAVGETERARAGAARAPGGSPPLASVRGVAELIRHGSRRDVYGLIVSDAEEVALECLRRFDDLWPHECQHVLDLQLQLSSEDGALWTPFLDALVVDGQWKWVAERFTAWGLRTDQLDAVRNRVRSAQKWVQREREWVLLLPLRAFRSPILIDALLSHARHLPAVALRELCMRDVRRLFSVARNPHLTDEAGNWLARIACRHAQALAAYPSSFFDLLYRALTAPGCSVDRCIDVLRALKCVADACPDDPALRLPECLESAILAEAIACEQFSGLTQPLAAALLNSTSAALRVSALPLLATMDPAGGNPVALDRLTRVGSDDELGA